MKTKTARKRKTPVNLPGLSFQFSTIHELIETMFKEEPTAKGTKAAFNRFNEGRGDEEWTGGINSLTQYFELLKNGYLPAVEALNIQAPIFDHSLNFVPDVVGQFNDIGAYMEGRPECMLNFQEVETNKFVKIYINPATGYKVKGQELMEKARLIHSGISELEAKGYRVECYLFNSFVKCENYGKIDISIKIKDFQDSLIPSFHGLLLGHIATTRLLMYSFASLFHSDNTLGPAVENNPNGEGLVFRFISDNKEVIKMKFKNLLI